MNTEEVAQMLRNDEHVGKFFQGVFSIDKLPHVRKKAGVYVVNTSPSHIPVGHWVAIVGDCFFCSYGINPSVYGIEGATYYSTKQLQAINSNVCGFYVIAYIKVLCRGHSSMSFMNCFTNDTLCNDDIIRLFFSTYID